MFFNELVIGNFFLWSTISVYVISYLRHFNPSVTISSTFVVSASLTTINEGVAPITAYIYRKRFNEKLLLGISHLCIFIALIAASISESLIGFILPYSIFFGIGSSMA